MLLLIQLSDADTLMLTLSVLFSFSNLLQDFGDSIPGHGGITDRMDCQVSFKSVEFILIKVLGYEQVIKWYWSDLLTIGHWVVGV